MEGEHRSDILRDPVVRPSRELILHYLQWGLRPACHLQDNVRGKGEGCVEGEGRGVCEGEGRGGRHIQNMTIKGIS